MFSNVGMIDRLVRLVIGAALITAPLINFMGLGASAAVTYLMIAIGVILGVTAVFGICPLYKLMGVSTKS
ncbi:MAG: YgaP family membrane protein [Yoonia sp.]